MGEETATSPVAAVVISTTGGGPTEALSIPESAGSPRLPENSRLSADTIRSGSLHNIKLLPSLPPRSSSTSAVPFSWEEHPGVPKASSKPATLPQEKQSTVTSSSSAAKQLPLPPPLRPGRASDGVLGRIKKRPGARAAGDGTADPFTVALVTCSRGDDDPEDDGDQIKGSGGGGWCEKDATGGLPLASAGKLVGYGWMRRNWRWGLVGDRFGLASCTTAGAVMDSTVRIPRRSLPATTTAATSSYGLPARRGGT